MKEIYDLRLIEVERQNESRFRELNDEYTHLREMEREKIAALTEQKIVEIQEQEKAAVVQLKAEYDAKLRSTAATPGSLSYRPVAPVVLTAFS